MNFNSTLKALEIHDRELVQQALANPVQALLQEFALPEHFRLLAAGAPPGSRLEDLLTKHEIDQSMQPVPVKKADTFEVSLHSPLFGKYFHRHGYFELDYVCRGNCRYYIEREDNVFTLAEGELCLINQNVAHALELADPSDVVLKCFIPLRSLDTELFSRLGRESVVRDFVTQSLPANTTYYSYIVFRPGETDVLQDFLARLIAEYIDQPLGWQQAADHYLALLFLELVRREDNSSVTRRSTFQDRVVARLLSQLREQLATVTLGGLAREYHFHENYLSRMIRQSTGRSFSEHLADCRLAEAERLLRTTALPVAGIAARVGYDGPSFLYRLFRARYGLTPLQYRAKVINGQS